MAKVDEDARHRRQATGGGCALTFGLICVVCEWGLQRQDMPRAALAQGHSNLCQKTSIHTSMPVCDELAQGHGSQCTCMHMLMHIHIHTRARARM